MGDDWCDAGTMSRNRSCAPVVLGTGGTPRFERLPPRAPDDDDVIYTTDPAMVAAIDYIAGPGLKHDHLIGVGDVPVGPIGGMFVTQYAEELSAHVPGLGKKPLYLMGGYDLSKGYRNYFIQPQAVLLDNFGRPQISLPATITYLGISNQKPGLLEMLRFISDITLVAGAAGELAKAASIHAAPMSAATGIPGLRPQIAADAMSLSFETVDQQVAFIVANVPGANAQQIRVLVEKAFENQSSVVLGGSRVSGAWTAASDLDVGFSSLTSNQAFKLTKKVSKLGPLKLEETRIVPGNFTDHIQLIVSPEEFFQRVGIRAASDGAKAGRVYLPSGSLTVRPGEIIYIPPGIRR
ncbi:MAG: hypothetical protein WAT41_00215 [Flavobacteriales bacterium]